MMIEEWKGERQKVSECIRQGNYTADNLIFSSAAIVL